MDGLTGKQPRATADLLSREHHSAAHAMQDAFRDLQPKDKVATGSTTDDELHDCRGTEPFQLASIDRLRRAQLDRVPYMFSVGRRDVASGVVLPPRKVPATRRKQSLRPGREKDAAHA
jgi:threonyl-tRNA synthetase